MKKILILSLSLLFLTGCSAQSNVQEAFSDTEATYNNSGQKQEDNDDRLAVGTNDYDPEEAEKSIEVKAVPTQGGELCVFLTNHNDFTVDELEVEVVFYDKDGNMIATDSDGHDMILPNATIVSRLDLPDTYDKFETNVTVEQGINSGYINHFDNIEIKHNTTDTGAIAQVKNNDSVTIDEVEIVAVFYNGDRIVSVSYPQNVYDLRPGKFETIEFSCYSSKSFNDLAFDRAEIYLNQAHTFGL